MIKNETIKYKTLLEISEVLQTDISYFINTAIAVKSNNGKQIPLVSKTAIAGITNTSITIEQKDIKALYVIPKFKHKNISFMLEVEGDSMAPTYKSGDIVACTLISKGTFIQWNKPHVVATNEQGILVKRIQEHEDTKRLIMISDNENYKPFAIPKKEINSIALVVGTIRLD